MDLERGGQLYVVYTGEAGREQYGVRVSGGTKIPVLDLSDTKDPAERLKLAEAYVNGWRPWSRIWRLSITGSSGLFL